MHRLEHQRRRCVSEDNSGPTGIYLLLWICRHGVKQQTTDRQTTHVCRFSPVVYIPISVTKMLLQAYASLNASREETIVEKCAINLWKILKKKQQGQFVPFVLGMHFFYLLFLHYLMLVAGRFYLFNVITAAIQLQSKQKDIHYCRILPDNSFQTAAGGRYDWL